MKAELLDFKIESSDEISAQFLKREIFSFRDAARFIQNLDYGRNSDKNNLKAVFTENKGTCSSKHALLKTLAVENGFYGIQLTIGIFRMNGTNTPKIKDRLLKYDIDFIPEAHTYLKYRGLYFDYTRTGSSANDFLDDLLFEVEIQPNEIGEEKVKIHQTFLYNWLDKNPELKYSAKEIWDIREECIADLSK